MVDGKMKENLTSIAVNMETRLGYSLDDHDLAKAFTAFADFKFNEGTTVLEMLHLIPRVEIHADP